MPAFIPDATYYSDAALRAFQRRQQLQELRTEGEYETQDMQESIRRLALQREPALQQTMEGAKDEGLFYSGQLGKRLGDVELGFAREQGDMQRDFQRRQAAREAARRAIEAGAPLEEAAAQAAAADRQLERDTEAADAGYLVENPAAPARRAQAPKPKPGSTRPKPRPRPRPQQQAGRGRAQVGPRLNMASGVGNANRPRRPRR